jgi:ABC-type uncharacterized transport system substrate-binding protein
MLMELGWIEHTQVPDIEDPSDTSLLWTWLASEVESEYLEFIPDAYWSSNWEDQLRQQNRETIIERLNAEDDIDLFLALGTWAGQDLASNEHSVPVVVFSASDPVNASIVSSAQDSGLDHVYAVCDPHQYIRQIRTFHSIVGFKCLGVVYEDTVEGRSWSNIDDLYEVAEERGFKIIERQAPETNLTDEECRDYVEMLYGDIAPEIDALWITVLRGEKAEYMPDILEPMFKHKVPTWAQQGPSQVKRGVLFSVSNEYTGEIGGHAAFVVSTILNGTSPREINQIFIGSRSLVVNLHTAELIDFDVPSGLLAVASETYDEIEDWEPTTTD